MGRGRKCTFLNLLIYLKSKRVNEMLAVPILIVDAISLRKSYNKPIYLAGILDPRLPHSEVETLTSYYYIIVKFLGPGSFSLAMSCHFSKTVNRQIGVEDLYLVKIF